MSDIPTESLESAIRAVALVNPKDPKKVKSASSRLTAAIDAQVTAAVGAQVVVAVAEIARQLKEHGLREGSSEAPAVHDGKAGGDLAAARAEGESFRNARWASDEMLSSDDAGKRLNISREALNQQRRAGRVLGLEAWKRGVRYPKWQFDDRVLPSVPGILAALSHLDPWGSYLFLTEGEPLLGGLTPLQALRDGKAADVLRIAHLLAAEAKGH